MSNTEKPKDECTLSDVELTDKVAEWANKLCRTGGKAWTLQVPINFNEDPDMLIVELIKRFNKMSEVSAENTALNIQLSEANALIKRTAKDIGFINKVIVPKASVHPFNWLEADTEEYIKNYNIQ